HPSRGCIRLIGLRIAVFLSELRSLFKEVDTLCADFCIMVNRNHRCLEHPDRMAAAQRRPTPIPDPDVGKKPRNDPDRLRAFAQRLNVMLGELGLPERGRARLIKERVGVSGTTAANWLRGESYPSFEEFGRMSQLGVDLSRLLPDATEAARSRASEERRVGEECS